MTSVNFTGTQQALSSLPDRDPTADKAQELVQAHSSLGVVNVESLARATASSPSEVRGAVAQQLDERDRGAFLRASQDGRPPGTIRGPGSPFRPPTWIPIQHIQPHKPGQLQLGGREVHPSNGVKPTDGTQVRHHHGQPIHVSDDVVFVPIYEGRALPGNPGKWDGPDVTIVGENDERWKGGTKTEEPKLVGGYFARVQPDGRLGPAIKGPDGHIISVQANQGQINYDAAALGQAIGRVPGWTEP